MTKPTANIEIPVDLTNPGQFFACCGLLELADRLWPGAEGWFKGDQFCINIVSDGSLHSIVKALQQSTVSNTMTIAQRGRLDELTSMKKKQREASPGLEDEKKALESLRRELPITFAGEIAFRIDWFCDEFSGGSRFKTWAGQQSVLDIAMSMHGGMGAAGVVSESTLWNSARGIGFRR